jgi:hypothetical protein
MVIRIFEYGYAQALKDKEMIDGVIILPFPRMVVIYLEAGASTPDTLTARMRFPDCTEHDFKVKTVKLLDYSVEELVERGLAALLPFCIIGLRKDAHGAKTEEERRKVEESFRKLGMKLINSIENSKERSLFDEADITTLLHRLIKLVDYVGSGYKITEVKKMADTSLMGYGQVLLMRGERRGKREAAMNALKIGIPMQQIVQITGIPEDEILKQLK